MSIELDEQIQQLKQAIAEIETRRPILGDAAVEASLAPIRQKLAELEAQAEPPREEPIEMPSRQRKLATILFMDVVGSTQMTHDLDPEDQMALVDPLIARLAEKVSEFGGHVSRYTGDGFKAVFGLPLARENDPEQAIRTGLAIRAEASEIASELANEHGITEFKVRLGITTGLVFAGGETEGEDTIKGNSVNLAARLQTAAPPGGLLISHDTYRHVRGVFNVDPHEPIAAKGFPEPVPVYLVREIKPRAFRVLTRGVEGVETRMVGRETELKFLKDTLLTAIEEREGQVVTVTGEAGVGKSRLLYELDNWIELLPPPPVRFFQGRSWQEAQSLPYSLLRDLFAFRFQILDDDTSVQACQKVESGFGEVFGDDEDALMRAHVLGQLLGFDFSASSHLRGVLNDPEQLRNRGLMYLKEYFQKLSQERTIVIFLEDIHWGDDSSLDAVDRLAELTHQLPLLIVCAARSVLYERRPHWGEEQTYHTQLKLLPLSEQESCNLLVEILQLVEEIPADMLEMVTNRAEGNPFYMEEMIKMLIEDGVIVSDQETWHVEIERLEQIHVPSTLAGVLQARLDGLPIYERTVLQQASVVGRLFWDRIVSYIQEQEGNGYKSQLIPPTLNSLRERELVYRHEESAFTGAVEYIFKHDVLREVTYESVPKRSRKLHHGMVSEWLIANSRERLGENSGVIADHLERAGMFEEALSFLCQAGKFAAKRYSNSEAEAYFARVLKVTKKVEPETDTSDSQLTAHIALGELQTMTCRFDEALKQFHLAQEIIECNDFSEKLPFNLAELYRRIAVVYERQSEYETAFKWLNRGLNDIETGEPSVEAARMYLLGAGIYHRQGKNDDALDWCRKSNAISSQIETAEAKRSLAQAYYLEGAVQCRLGNLNKSIDLIKQSLQIYMQIDDVLGQARAYNNISIACMDLGEWDQASENLQKSLEISQRIGDIFEQGSVQNNLACIQLDRGEWDQAKSLLLESNKIWKRIGASLPYAVTLSNLAQVYLFEENWSDACKILHESESIFAEIGTVDYLSELERRWGEYYLGINDTGQALNHTQRSMELAEEIDSPLDKGMTWRVIGEIYTRREEYDPAEKALVDSYETFQELGSEYEAAKTILALTHLALERGTDVDRDKLEVAIQVFERLNARAYLINAQSLANHLS